MKLPNAEHAVVDMKKLTQYCLDETHPRGKHKARVFASVLGMTADRALVLQHALLAAALSEDAELTERDIFGQRYTVDFRMDGPSRSAVVRSSWLIRTGEDFPRLTSCYIL